MKRFTLTALLLTLTGLACAQQPIGIHREHVAERLEAASGFLLLAEGQISTFARYYADDHVSSVGALAEPNVRANVDYALLYIARAQNSIVEILSKIPVAPAAHVSGEIDLFDLRRAINMPFENALCGSEDLCQVGVPFESLAYELSVVSRHISRLTGAHIKDPNWGTYDAGANLRSAGKLFSSAWAEAEFAIWHMNDAIYQEVYGAH